ncbi:LuxR C-terminal-related transcriptional regulator [uncultured Roseovarius sp.]|uniref:response regulator transcription factor n=1 Tax=uncultured Roseovarius sp. TaxID=293344 RepID=UPI00261E1ACF|nr:LuxR C-terminal-related transcriptional regulator [uncultured Roseovarius sp.]
MKLVSGVDVFSVLDRDGNTVFSSENWEVTVGRYAELSNAVFALSHTDQTNEIPSAGGYVTSLNLEEDFALAPGGKVILVTIREKAHPSLSLEEVIENLYSELLTPREIAISKLVLQGHPTASIAENLGISIGTVKNHRKRMYRKLDITTEREFFLAVLSWLSESET